jgi:hypothetical protein
MEQYALLKKEMAHRLGLNYSNLHRPHKQPGEDGAQGQ